MFTLPTLITGNIKIDRAFRIAMGDLAGNIQLYKGGLLEKPEPCLMAGIDYDSPWTRDAAINSWYGFGLLAPETARNTLLSVLTKDNMGIRIGGQYWDAIVWVTGAWETYLYSGDKSLLALAYVAARNSIQYFEETEFDPEDGLFRGGACFQDGVAGYPDLFTMADYQSSILEWVDQFPEKKAVIGFGLPMKALSTNCLYYHAYQVLLLMAAELGWTAPTDWHAKASALKQAINNRFWNDESETYRYLVDAADTQERQEGYGSAFALLFDIASPEQVHRILENQVTTENGLPCLWPTYERYARADGMAYGRHSGTIWPQVNAAWAAAAAKHGRPETAYFELKSLAEKSCRDMQFKELYHPINGEAYGGLQESPIEKRIITWEACNRQSWCASGYLYMVLKVLLGMNFNREGIVFQPYLPEEIDSLHIQNLPYRNAKLDIRVERGISNHPYSVAAATEGNIFIEIFV